MNPLDTLIAIALYIAYLIAGACLLAVVALGLYILTARALVEIESDDINRLGK
jgi:hypothetical protein